MSDFYAKMNQNRFRLGLRHRPHWGSAVWGSLQRSPRPPSWIKGGLLLREGEGHGKGGEGEERRGRHGREGRRGEGTGREGTPNILLHPQFQFSRNMPAKQFVVNKLID